MGFFLSTGGISQLYEAGMTDSYTTKGYLPILRRVINEAVQSIALHESVYTAEDVGFATSVATAELAAVADLNGDGMMEIVLNVAYYEGAWSLALENRDYGQPVEVLGCGLGV